MLRLLGILVAALTLAACTSDDDAARQPPDSSVLEPLTDDGACELIGDASVEKALDAAIERKWGLKVGAVERGISAECTYDPALRVLLSTTRQEYTEQDLLDRAFTDMTKEWRPVIEYDDVPDLGTDAGFGRNATLGEHADSRQLTVLFDVEGERLSLDLVVHGPATLDQLRRLAEELMANLTG